MREFYVNYTIGSPVKAEEKEYQFGPVKDEYEAEIHLRDIKGYEGLSHCFIVEQRDFSRELIQMPFGTLP